MTAQVIGAVGGFSATVPLKTHSANASRCAAHPGEAGYKWSWDWETNRTANSEPSGFKLAVHDNRLFVVSPEGSAAVKNDALRCVNVAPVALVDPVAPVAPVGPVCLHETIRYVVFLNTVDSWQTRFQIWTGSPL